MKEICLKCNKEIKSFTCNYECDMTEHYLFNEDKGTFVRESYEIDNDRNSYFYCNECGETLPSEIVDKLFSTNK